MATRIDKLTDEQKAQIGGWADRWVEIGLRTGAADRPKFEGAVRECYRFTKLDPPKAIVWVPSPLVAITAGPIASKILEDPSVGNRIDLFPPFTESINQAIAEATRGAGADKVMESGEARQVIRALWHHYIGGQFWVGGWGWGGAWTSFFREVCDLELPGDLWDRAKAYEATLESACWWWPHREFVVVSERPMWIHREEVGPRGPNSHRLHASDCPAVAWSDGWAVYSWHGTRVPADVIMNPDTITLERVNAEVNAEVRRAMIEKRGWDWYLSQLGSKPIQEDRYGALYQTTLNDVAVGIVIVTDSSHEADGTFKRYGLIVNTSHKTAHEAVAATFGMTTEEYRPVRET